MKKLLLSIALIFGVYFNAKAQSVNFDGQDDYISISSGTGIPLGNNAYTIEAWIKADAMGTEGIVGWGNYGSTNQVNAFRLTGNGLVNYWWGNDLTVTTGDISGAWHHVAATYDGTTRSIYLDGKLVGSDNPGTNNVPNVANLGIGVTFFNEYFSGSIDEVRIWDIARTQAQIQDNMNCSLSAQADLVLNYTFDGGAATPNQNNAGISLVMDHSGNSNTGTLTNFTLNGTTSNWVNNVNTLNPVAYATIGADVTSIGVGTTVTFTAAAVNGGSNPTYQWMKNNMNVGSNSDTYTDNTLINKDTVTCMITSSGNCISKDSISNKIGIKVSSNLAASLNFDGNNDYVDIGTINLTSFTKEAWVYANAGASCNIISSNDAPFWIMGGSLSAVVGFGGGGTVIQDPNPFPLGVWTHVAVTYDAINTTLTLYTNGVQVAQNTSEPAYIVENIYLGMYGGGNNFNGNMDEIHIWNVARTAAQIQQDMNCSFVTGQTGLVAGYNFNEGTPNANNTGLTTLTDNSGNGNDGTLYNFDLTGGSTSNWTDDVNMVGVLPALNVVGTSTLCSGYTTTLTASGATTYTWSANASSATTSTVSVSPNSTDTYTVTGANGVCLVMDTLRITVTASPTVSITGATTLCAGNTTTLTASGANTYTWSANAASATTASVSLNPASSDTYTVTGDDGTCTSKTTVLVNVTATPTITVTGNQNICSGQTTTLTAHGATNYTWTPGNAHSAVIHVPALTTTTSFSLAGSTNGCFGSLFIGSINVTPTPTVNVNSSAGPICAGDNVTLTASGATTYTWSANAASATTSSVSLTPSATDTYTVTGANGSCTTNKTVTVNVNSLPILSVNGLTVCAGNTTTLTASGANTYTWSTTETTASIVSTPTATTTDYTVTGTDNNFCVNSIVATVTLNALPNVAVNNVAICAGNTATLTANGAATYTWSTTETTGSISATPTATTTDYTVTGTDINNCVNSAVATVTVNALPTVSVNSATICTGGTATLTASGTAATYTWSTTETTSSIITPTASATMDYTVTGEDANNCTNTAIATVTVSQPTVTVNSVAICAGGTATLTANGAITYTWSTTETTASIAPTPTAPTTDYTVTGSDANNCTNMAIATVTVNANPTITFNVSPNTFCTTDPTATLTASPSGGSFTGTGVSNGTFDPATAGVGTFTITYTYTDANSCNAVQDASVTVQNCGNGISQISNSNAISTYPNPTNNDLFIQTNTLFDNAIVEIYSMLGQKVLTARLQDNLTRLSLGSLSNAVYQVRVYNNTTLIYQSKIVKQQ